MKTKRPCPSWVCFSLSLCIAFSGCGGNKKSKENKTAGNKPGSTVKDSTSNEKSKPEKDAGAKVKTPKDNSGNKSSGVDSSSKDSSQNKTVAKKETPSIGSQGKHIDQKTVKPNSNKDPERTVKVVNSDPPKTGNVKEVVKDAEPKDDPKVALDKLNALVDNFQVPPPWIGDVKSNWNVANKPWKEARIEIRRLLGLNTEAARREGIKLTWDYLQKNDIGDKHEYGMYMFLGGEPIWAVIAYRERLAEKNLSYPPFFGVIALASLYSDYGAYEEAEKVLKRGVKMRPPKREWYEMREAEMHDALGDLYAVWGKLDQAKSSYREAIRLYPLGKPPYGRHLLPRRAKKVQTKLDLLSAASLANTSLKNGTYQEKALGYSGDINLSVQVAGGKIAKINVRHQEKIDQNACKIIPQRIVEKQSLTVDGISGATITKDAIVAGTLRALRKAGLD